jgi:magnesium transporter
LDETASEKPAAKKRTLTRRAQQHRFGGRRTDQPGMSPGQLIADPNAEPTVINVVAYGPSEIVEKQNVTFDELLQIRNRHHCLWVDIHGLRDVAILERLGTEFALHPLALEDVVGGRQRAKVEEYPHNLFLVARMINPGGALDTEQFSLFIGHGFVISFQATAGDCFDHVRTRLRKDHTRIRNSSADYLAYALLDAVIDAYFPALDLISAKFEELEDAVVNRPDREFVSSLHHMKHDLLTFRRELWPHRDMISTLIRQESGLITDQTDLFLRDCYDHVVQLVEMVETYREIASGLLDLYLSSLSNRMNEIMKVLTIIATIFIPLGFIAGVYGMNFDRSVSPWNMPELGWVYGYPFALGLMGVIGAGLVYYFWRKGWIGRGPR